MTELDPEQVTELDVLSPQSPGAVFWTQMKKSPLAIAGGVILAIFYLLALLSYARSLAEAARRAGVRTEPGDGFDDVFFRLFLERVEPRLGRDRPTYLLDYPASMAALARLGTQDPTVAERFELYAHGLELANGFSELTDTAEQRRRLEEERAFRVARGRPAYPLDEAFLEAVGRMPPSGGVAIGLDRVLMLLLGSERIEDVLLFPAHGFV